MDVLIFQLFANGLVVGSFYALAGVSWGIIYKTTKTFHFSHHLVFTVAGYTAALVTTNLHQSYFVGFVSAVLIAVIFGCSIDAFLYRRMRMMGAIRDTIFLASVGLGTAGVALILLLLSSNPRSLTKAPAKILSIGLATVTTDDLVMFVGSWLLILFLLTFLNKSKYGKAIIAVGSNEEMAKNLGFNINRIYTLVFALGSFLFGCAAFFFAAKNVAYPTMGLLPFFMSFTAVFLGGVTSIFGHALAGLMLGLAENLGMAFLPGEYKLIISFTILFIVILIKPEGLMSGKRG